MEVQETVQEPKLMSGAAVAGSAGQVGEDEQEFNIRDTEGVVKGYMLLHDVNQPIIDKYRDIRNGEGRRKGDVAAGREYLFKRCYGKKPSADGATNAESGFRFAEKFAGCQLDLRSYKGTQRDKEIAFWLAECEKIVDATLFAYLNYFYPDVDSKKS